MGIAGTFKTLVIQYVGCTYYFCDFIYLLFDLLVVGRSIEHASYMYIGFGFFFQL